jgi:hypothetical protein
MKQESGKLVDSVPENDAAGVALSDPITLVFDQGIYLGSLKVQEGNGPCYENAAILVSPDHFKTCAGGSVSMVPDTDEKQVNFKPSAPLLPGQNYEVKLTPSVGFELYAPLKETVFTFSTYNPNENLEITE